MGAAWVLASMLASSGFAGGTLYVNGVQADGLKDFSFTDVNVRVDASGDIWIDAPRYGVQVADGVAAKDAAVVPPSTWWLVTEDRGSRGAALDVIINDTLVARVRSGDPQLIKDLAPHLSPGRNKVEVRPTSGRAADGGRLVVYVGTGGDQSGTLVLDPPRITHVHEPGRQASLGSYELQIR